MSLYFSLKESQSKESDRIKKRIQDNECTGQKYSEHSPYLRDCFLNDPQLTVCPEIEYFTKKTPVSYIDLSSYLVLKFHTSLRTPVSESRVLKYGCSIQTRNCY